jgi:hypothetical protein
MTTIKNRERYLFFSRYCSRIFTLKDNTVHVELNRDIEVPLKVNSE